MGKGIVMRGHIAVALSKYIDDEGVVTDLATDILNVVVEQCYLTARGTDQLQAKGNRQLYWKGRCDAAGDVGKLKVPRD